MNKHIIILTLAALFFLPFAAQAEAPEGTVEIMLVSNLDETRGYCLDIAGGKGANAPLDKGLQAHTCYHYTGAILEDQGFEEALISEGRFRIPYFDVCMSVTAIQIGATTSLEECSNSDNQKFTLKPNGQLVSQVDPTLCLTVNSLEKKEGRGAFPVHVMRSLSLQLCDETIRPYQTWSINKL
jgi:hypothetical protein